MSIWIGNKTFRLRLQPPNIILMPRAWHLTNHKDITFWGHIYTIYSYKNLVSQHSLNAVVVSSFLARIKKGVVNTRIQACSVIPRIWGVLILNWLVWITTQGVTIAAITSRSHHPYLVSIPSQFNIHCRLLTTPRGGKENQFRCIMFKSWSQ